MSTPARWHHVERLYHAALALDEPERSAFVRDASEGDEALRREVDSLLAYSSDPRRFLETPAIEVLASGFVEPHQIPSTSSRQRLGPYEIGALLGSGGMGDVYRARDTTLGRDVAIKILPAIFTSDPQRRARFDREARVLAALNHPHIAAIYGVEHHDDVHGLVLELVEGQTLAERLRTGPLPIDEALTLATEIAEALEAAHERGIVHRDLKPANVTVTRDGRVKVLDFGLAKAGAGGTPDVTRGPIEPGDRTLEGVIFGSAAYMSPEQARGKAVDKRTDIWAFGCVLWEMLTARRCFGGETVSDTIAAVLEREPDWALLPAATPAGVARLLRRCLEKDPKRRLHDIADARIDIEEALRAPVSPSLPQAPRAAPLLRSRRIWIGAAMVAVLAALTIVAAIYLHRPPAAMTATRLSLSTPGLLSPQLSAAISPDGRHVAFVATGDSGKLMLWIRSLDSMDARVLQGTENAAHPFWSPDGRFLGFLADGKVKKIEAGGGPVHTLADAAERAGPSWSKDGRILFVSAPGELGTVPADGGPIATVVRRRQSGLQVSWPHFLPDGRHFLYFVGAAGDQRGVYVGSIDSGQTKQILRTDVKAAYASGYVLFVRDETLMAQPFDLERLELTGTPSRVADGIWAWRGAGQASFSVSPTGVLAYVSAAMQRFQIGWFDRAGRSLGTLGPPRRYAGVPQLSPDARHVAIEEGPSTSHHIWVMDIAGESTSRVSFGAIRDVAPVWSPDGRRIAFLSQGTEGMTLYVRNADGSGSEEPLFEFESVLTIGDWSPDGRFIVYTARGARGASDIWVLPLFGDRRPQPFRQTAFNKTQVQVSPDSRWIAYTSYESGRDEVYVESFPTGGSKRQISAGGGVQPRWRSNGQELYYVAADQRLMAVPVDGSATFQAGVPIPLFRTGVFPHGSQSFGLPTMYDVSPDGQRFLCMVPPEEAYAPITIVLNWMAALK